MTARNLARVLRALLPPWSSPQSSTPAETLESPATHARADWEQIQDVLIEALERDASGRLSFVEEALADRPALADEVFSLLAAHAGAGMLDRAPPDLSPHPDESFPAPGSTFGRYEVLDRLGGGGMGVVYRARDLRLERLVALKFLPPHLVADERTRERFLVEAQAAAALDHANICTVHEIGETDDGHLFLAMPFYDGETLKHRLANALPDPRQATDIAIQVAQGLASAHEGGIVHRDIKPANLIVTSVGVVKILDFGVAKLADVSLTRPGVTPGTVAYMSPEQARGDEVDARTDLWSLGVVLYEMLAGERPFRGGHDAVVLSAIQVADPPPIATLRPDVSPALEQVVSRALCRVREERYSTAEEMVEALEQTRAVTGASPAPINRSAVRPGVATPVGPRNDAREESSGGVLPEGERRLATILASTLSGYNVLVANLAPEEVERLVGRIREEADAVAVRHGGTLNHFAGDRIVLLFGVRVTHEDDGVRAARAALELHARVRALSGMIEEAGGPTLRLHTGIDTGRVIVHADTDHGVVTYRVAGSAADIALRLAMHAGVDEVWASPECRHMIAAAFETEPRDAFTVRGRAEPLVPHHVLAESEFQTRFEAAGKAGLTPYVERTTELATLQRCLDRALRGDGQLVEVTGEAGIGKSRLIHEFRSTLASRDVSWLTGRCRPDATVAPYLPFIEILRGGLRLGEPGPDELESTLSRIRDVGAELEEFIPLYLHLLSIHTPDSPTTQHLQGDAFRLLMQEALAAILSLSARRRPCVILLEDLHWADDASLTVLKQMTELLAGHRLLLIVTSRTGSRADWNTDGLHTHIPLRPLDPSSLASLLRSFLQVPEVPEELGALLHERTGGNPFFLEETCMALLEEGALRIENGAARLTDRVHLLDLPDSVEAVIRARLDRLDDSAREVLRLASVVGREFTRRVLEGTVTDEARLPDALDTLKAAGLVQQIQVAPEALYRFKHVLTQEVAYASILEHQRTSLHGRVGARLELLGGARIDDHLERLAHHFNRAEEWTKAVEYGMRSAERAAALAQYAEALQILERTQRRIINLRAGGPRQDALVEILLRQDRLAETLGLRSRQQQIIDELIALLEPDGDAATRAEVFLRQGDLFALLHRFAEGEEALQRSLLLRRDLGDTAGERKALRSLGLLRWYQGRNREALTCIAEVVAIDRERQDIVALVGDLISLAVVLKTTGEQLQARARLEEGIALAEEAIRSGSPAAGDLRVKQAYILNALSILCREAGDMDGALEYLSRSEKIAEVERLPVYLPYHHVAAARIHLQQGSVEEGLARYRTAVELTRKARYLPGLSQTLCIQGEVLLGLGRYDEALLCLEEAAALFGRMQELDTEAHVWTLIAAAHGRMGDNAAAMTAWSRARALCRQSGSASGELAALEGLGATARRSAPDTVLALTHYREAVRLAQAMNDRAAEGRLRNTIGILEWSRGEYAEALHHYERALLIFRGLGDMAHAGLMLNSVAVTLRELGRPTEAQDRFVEAVTLHRQTGERQLEGHALAVLGDISCELGETGEAAAYYRESLVIRRETGDRRGEGWMLYNLARTDGATEPEGAAVARALLIAEECGDSELATACDQLSRVAAYQPPSP